MYCDKTQVVIQQKLLNEWKQNKTQISSQRPISNCDERKFASHKIFTGSMNQAFGLYHIQPSWLILIASLVPFYVKTSIIYNSYCTLGTRLKWWVHDTPNHVDWSALSFYGNRKPVLNSGKKIVQTEKCCFYFSNNF